MFCSIKKHLVFILIISTSISLFSCKGKKKKNGNNEVRIHELSDPDMILPYNSTSADATYMEQLVFQKLIEIDYKTGEFVGVLAKGRPVITEITEGVHKGGIKLEYEIRPEATWDNGSPITGYDVLFSMKAVLNPKTNCENVKPYFDWIADIQVDSINPKKITFYSREKYILVEEYSGYWVLPEYIYDANKTMRAFSITDMNTPEKRAALKGNDKIIQFADAFNSEKFQREKGSVVGSGPYTFEKWETGQTIEMVKKKNWWANTLNSIPTFQVLPEKITYKIINDWTTAATALKDGQLDLATNVEAKIFDEFQKSDAFKEKNALHTPSQNAYVYVGLNLNNPKFKELAVRKALAHCINRKQIIDVLLYGLAEPSETLLHPSKPEYNKDIKPFEYSIDSANLILDRAGWKDSDGDGIRDKKINGQLVKLSFEYKFNNGNETRKNIGIMLKEEAKKVGMEVNIVSKEWTVFLQELDKHNFEMYCGSWVGDPNVEDPKQIWHTSSSNGGSNYVFYGNKETDDMIEAIRHELDATKRDVIYKKFQQRVHDDIPYIFLYAPKQKSVFSKRFNAEPYTTRPGYVVREWKLVQ